MSNGYPNSAPPITTHNSHHSVKLLVAKALIGSTITIVVSGLLLCWCCAYYHIRRIANPIADATPTITVTIAAATTNSVNTLRDVSSSLPTFVYSPSSPEDKLDCPVCLTEFKVGEEGRVLPICYHKFHKECIELWFQSHSTCPVCRSTVELPA